MSPSEESLTAPILSPSVFAATTTRLSLAEEIRASQAQDPWAKQRLQEFQEGPAGDFANHLGLLFHRGRLYVPLGPLQTNVLYLTHDSLPVGHIGRYKTLHLLTQELW